MTMECADVDYSPLKTYTKGFRQNDCNSYIGLQYQGKLADFVQWQIESLWYTYLFCLFWSEYGLLAQYTAKEGLQNLSATCNQPIAKAKQLRS